MLFFTIVCLLSLFLRKDYFVIFNDIFSFGILLTIIFLSQLIYPIFLIKNRILEFIGRHSYGIYLSHLIVLRYINLFLGEHRNEKIVDIIGYFLLVMISCVFSVVSENLIEKKAIKYLKWYRKRWWTRRCKKLAIHGIFLWYVICLGAGCWINTDIYGVPINWCIYTEKYLYYIYIIHNTILRMMISVLWLWSWCIVICIKDINLIYLKM